MYNNITEDLKMLMSQSSLKYLELYYPNPQGIVAIPFTTYPGAVDCLGDLSALKCHSDVYSETLDRLSQMCHHIQSLDVVSFRTGWQI